MSKYRIDPTMAEPTVSTMAIDADRTGFHYEIIICDDIEAERNSATREQIERVWDFYRLLYSLVHKRKKDPHSGRILIAATRWHYDDIYARIEAQNYNEPEDTKFSIIKIPDRDPETKELNFPTILDAKKLANIRRKQGPYIYSCQYQLSPIPDADRVFKSNWIQYVTPQHIQQRLSVYVGADFAYIPYNQRSISSANRETDYTVIITVGVDEAWNYIFLDWYRKRCTKKEAVEELFRQYYAHNAMCAALQKYDKALIAETIEQYGYDYREKTGSYLPRIEWIQYPSQQKKRDRIETTLQRLFADGKVFILQTMEWFKTEEILDFPKNKHDDCCDALCNIVKVASPPPKTRVPRKRESLIYRMIKQLEAGTFDPDGDEVNWKTL
jgi:predicted phage terminase large subunit-like protein